jgi:hypothetical protein
MLCPRILEAEHFFSSPCRFPQELGPRLHVFKADVSSLKDMEEGVETLPPEFSEVRSGPSCPCAPHLSACRSWFVPRSSDHNLPLSCMPCSTSAHTPNGLTLTRRRWMFW